jgi:hypothetical protein
LRLGRAAPSLFSLALLVLMVVQLFARTTAVPKPTDEHNRCELRH